MTDRPLDADAVFAPDRIAVVGASADPEKLSNRPVRFLQAHGYAGEIYPVNPNAETVAGMTAYPSVSSLPDGPELALVMLPAALVEETVEECFDAGIETVVVVSSGFGETGDADAIVAERRLAALADERGGWLIGPNSQGLIDVPTGLAASFTPALDRETLQPGGVSVVTQSGAMGGALATLLQDRGVGLNRWVSSGNEAQVDAIDLIVSLAADEGTDVVAGYIEGLTDGRRLVSFRRSEVGVDVPIVLLKVGRSARGREAAASHTGTLAGDHTVYESVFGELGVIGVDDVDELVDVVATLKILPTLPGERLGIVSTSGGAGVHLADVAAGEGLTVPDLDQATREAIAAHIPPYGSAANPVDITAQVSGDPAAFTACLEQLLADATLDTVVLQLTNIGGDRAAPYADRIVDVAAGHETPLVVSWTGGLAKAAGVASLEAAGIPVFENPARCIRTVARLTTFATAIPRLRSGMDRPPGPSGPTTPPEPVLAEPAAKARLAEYGIRVPAGRVVNSTEAAIEAAKELGVPVVAKLISTELAHRAAVGGVRPDLTSDGDVREAVTSLFDLGTDLDIPVDGISIQEQVPAGLELAAGIATSDFGPVVMLGRGGSAFETIGDTTFRTIPTSPADAVRMVDDLETIPPLDEPVVEAVVDAICALSALAMANPWIAEVDVNPLVVADETVIAVDALIVGDRAE